MKTIMVKSWMLKDESSARAKLPIFNIQLLTIIILCQTLFLSAQIDLKITCDQSADFLKKRDLKTEQLDSVEVRPILEKLIADLRNETYFTASLDSLFFENKTAFAKIYVGNRFEKLNLRTSNIDPHILARTGFFRKENSKNQSLDFSKLKKLQTDILEIHENLGYPFAQVFLDSIEIEKGKASAVLTAQKGDLIYFKKLEIDGDASISERFLSNYLGIEAGEVYNRNKVLKIPKRLRELPFLKEATSAKIDFRFDRATVKLDLKAKPASRFDFIIGVLPKNSEFDRLLVTGNFTAEFQNQFGKGERIFADIRQLRPQSPEVDLAFDYPYIFDSSLGADFEFGLYKRDTNYIDIDFDLGIRYLLEGGNYFKGFFKQFTSNILSINELQLLSQKRLPRRLDVRRSEIGVEFFKQKLDYRFNPRKGWETKITTSGGVKNIQKNALILDLSDMGFDFKNLYDSLDLQTFQSRNSASVAAYFPTVSNQTLKLGLVGSYILSPTPILQNEQHRIGGNRLLRGFDEESIFATNFAVATAEYRLLTGQNSYLFAFADAAFVEDKTTETDVIDFPYGFGAGVTFDTSAGIFGLSYALGSRLGNSIDFRAGKIHFGYLSLF